MNNITVSSSFHSRFLHSFLILSSVTHLPIKSHLPYNGSLRQRESPTSHAGSTRIRQRDFERWDQVQYQSQEACNWIVSLLLMSHKLADDSARSLERGFNVCLVKKTHP